MLIKFSYAVIFFYNPAIYQPITDKPQYKSGQNLHHLSDNKILYFQIL